MDRYNFKVWAQPLETMAYHWIGERVAVTGTVKRWLRISTTGTFTDLDYLVGVRRGESYDDVDGS